MNNENNQIDTKINIENSQNKLDENGLELFTKAKEKSNGAAYLVIGEWYADGKFGLPKEVETAIKFLIEAEKLLPEGDKEKVKGPYAKIFKNNDCTAWERIVKNSNSPTLLMEYANYLSTVKKDKERAIQYYGEAARNHEPEGYYKAALLLLEGNGLEDIDKAKDNAIFYFDKGIDKKRKQKLFKEINLRYIKFLNEPEYKNNQTPIIDRLRELKKKADEDKLPTKTWWLEILKFLILHAPEIVKNVIVAVFGFALTILLSNLNKNKN